MDTVNTDTYDSPPDGEYALPYRALLYVSASHDPHVTLAAEEVFLENLPRGHILLYLYTHNSSVIVGRNQNAWAECKHELLLEEGGRLARRISGGGAVYHDPQNLNFSFIVPRAAYDLQRQCGVILEAVRSFRIEADLSGRNDILVQGRKFSGNAFCFRGENAFHHGTILIDTDPQKMQRYLSVSANKLKTKGVASVRSRVINLKALVPDLTSDLMSERLIAEFEKEYGQVTPLEVSDAMRDQIKKLAERNATWDWIFGKSPRFDAQAETRFSWGGIQFLFTLQKGVVQSVQVFSDALDEQFIGELPVMLKEVPFRSGDLAEAVKNAASSEHTKAMADDIARFFLSCEY